MLVVALTAVRQRKPSLIRGIKHYTSQWSLEETTKNRLR